MIYLKFNYVYTSARCHLTNTMFDCDEILAFFVDNDMRKTVCADWALTEGFTMEHETYMKLNEIAMDYWMKSGEEL